MPPEDPQNLRGQTVVHSEKPQELLSTHERVPLTDFTCAGEKLKFSNLARTFYSNSLGISESSSCQESRLAGGNANILLPTLYS